MCSMPVLEYYIFIWKRTAAKSTVNLDFTADFFYNKLVRVFFSAKEAAYVFPIFSGDYWAPGN